MEKDAFSTGPFKQVILIKGRFLGRLDRNKQDKGSILDHRPRFLSYLRHLYKSEQLLK